MPILAERAGQDADVLRAMIVGDLDGAAASLGSPSDASRKEVMRVFGDDGGDKYMSGSLSPEDILLRALLVGAASAVNMDKLEGEDKELAELILSSGGIAEIMAKIGAMEIYCDIGSDKESEEAT